MRVRVFPRGGGPTIPPSINAPPASRMMPSTSCMVCGDTALQSAKTVFFPVRFIAAATSRALSIAAPGFSTDRIMSQLATSFSTDPQSSSPASFASCRVRPLRPSSAVKTLQPLSLRQPAIAWPMSPGLTTPTFLMFIVTLLVDAPGPRGRLAIKYTHCASHNKNSRSFHSAARTPIVRSACPLAASSAVAPLRRCADVPVYLIILATVLTHTSFKGSKVLISLYAIDLGANPLTIGMLFSMYSFFPMFLSLYAGRLSDRLGARLPMLFGACGLWTGLLLPYLVPRLEALYVSATLIGMCYIFYTVAVQHLIGSFGEGTARTRNYS